MLPTVQKEEPGVRVGAEGSGKALGVPEGNDFILAGVDDEHGDRQAFGGREGSGIIHRLAEPESGPYGHEAHEDFVQAGEVGVGVLAEGSEIGKRSIGDEGIDPAILGRPPEGGYAAEREAENADPLVAALTEEVEGCGKVLRFLEPEGGVASLALPEVAEIEEE